MCQGLSCQASEPIHLGHFANTDYMSVDMQRRQVNRHRHRRAPRASQACDYCAAAKARCDNNVCCQRCQKRNIPCIRPTALNLEASRIIINPEQSHPAENNLSSADDLCLEAVVGDRTDGSIFSPQLLESLGHSPGKFSNMEPRKPLPVKQSL